uniref:Uncharacterized protein n=1 Tax=Kwoniella bestiolae CBS 10118 TaxID=1296100 RepID=A0A1B9G6C8_9TREE|nr:hypothetical protein I302_04239 [Kwoniella bestiolae CBS 10118]OCF26553.1 hypothetical protein I302_04239 [Kwoniella bestiolae CBS 10118]
MWTEQNNIDHMRGKTEACLWLQACSHEQSPNDGGVSTNEINMFCSGPCRALPRAAISQLLVTPTQGRSLANCSSSASPEEVADLSGLRDSPSKITAKSPFIAAANRTQEGDTTDTIRNGTVSSLIDHFESL